MIAYCCDCLMTELYGSTTGEGDIIKISGCGGSGGGGSGRGSGGESGIGGGGNTGGGGGKAVEMQEPKVLACVA